MKDQLAFYAGRHGHSVHWYWVGLIVALYLLVRFALAYRERRAEGSGHPAREVFDTVRHPRPREERRMPFARFWVGRGVLIVGMALMIPVALIPSMAARIALLGVFGPVVIAAVAYADFRTSSRRRRGGADEGSALAGHG